MYEIKSAIKSKQDSVMAMRQSVEVPDLQTNITKKSLSDQDNRISHLESQLSQMQQFDKPLSINDGIQSANQGKKIS